jgi:hypothetical protein
MSSWKMSWCTSLFLAQPAPASPVELPVVAIVHHLRCWERHPACMERLYRWVEKRYLASVDGFICVAAPPPKTWRMLVGQAAAW